MTNPLKNLITSGIGSAADHIANGASTVIKTLKADPTEVAKLNEKIAELANEAKKNGEDYAVAMETQYTEQQKIVNEEMSAEGKSEHWMVWSWRPFLGFTLALMIINNFIVMPYMKKYGLQPIEIPDNLFYSLLVILGAASAGRGLMQWQRAKNEGQ